MLIWLCKEASAQLPIVALTSKDLVPRVDINHTSGNCLGDASIPYCFEAGEGKLTLMIQAPNLVSSADWESSATFTARLIS